MPNHNSASLETMRRGIRDGSLREACLQELLEKWTSGSRGGPRHSGGYDDLDEFVGDLLLDGTVPEACRALEPEMVQYQPTPVRVLLALLNNAQVGKDDVFFDVGSGLGQAALLVNLLTGAMTVGVEFESAYCDYAHRRALDLNLERVNFRNEDARVADYREGTVFFLYTPVMGEMLQDVLERIHNQTCDREIRVLTYGPCTDAVAALPWLRPTGSAPAGPESMGSFLSSGPRHMGLVTA